MTMLVLKDPKVWTGSRIAFVVPLALAFELFIAVVIWLAKAVS